MELSCAGGADYEILAGEMLMFSVGSPNGATSCIYIIIIDEVILEFDENFTFDISTSDPVEPNTLNGNVLIVNDDGEFSRLICMLLFCCLQHCRSYAVFFINHPIMSTESIV